jgi:proteasome lid subunit RPN8/RPN11
LSLRDVTKSIQLFLDEVFSERRNYQPFLLKYFHIDKELLQIYEEKNKNMEEIVVSDYRSTRSGKVYTSHYDKNSIYLSIQIYKQLWIEDHYEFYMKVGIT